MADPIRVKLNKLDPAAYLESTTGTVVTAAGQSRLDGSFVIVIAGQKSNPVSFNASDSLALVAASGSDWALTTLGKTQFSFGVMLLLRDASGPWLGCQSCWLIQQATVGSMAMLSLEDSRVSLTATGADPGARSDIYPTQTG